MRVIVADTTPLNYLILINAAEILPQLYENVLIPPAVYDELSHRKAPDLVRAWIAQRPSWLDVAKPELSAPSLLYLGAGEREAIALAAERHTNILLMDDRDGVAMARQRGLTVVGTLAVLDQASVRNLIDLPTMFDRLFQTTFRSPRRLMRTMLEQDAQRKRHV